MMKNRYHLKRYIRWLATSVIAVLGSLIMAGGVAAADLASLSSCVACHGADGMGKASQYPNLQGQKVGYMVKQLQDFKSGVRKDSAMTTVAILLSDDDMVKLAKYFASVK